MPKLASYILAWSASHQAYELYESQRNTAVNLTPESSEWFVWVSQVSSFAFHGQHGSYTARKECKQRGEGYWYAYARVGEKLTKRYLGKGTDLTPARLERVAQELWRCPQAALPQQEGTESAQSLSAPPVAAAQLSGPPRQMNEEPVSLSDDAQLRNFCADPLSSVGRERSESARKTASACAEAASLSRSHKVYVLYNPATPTLPASPHRSGSCSTDRNSHPARSYLSNDLLLATKFHVPRPPLQLLPRPRLIRHLLQGLERPLILVSAPAGFGKSTLLADWLASNALPAAWLSLGPQDNDPIRFFSYLLAALQTYDPYLGRMAQELLHPLRPPALETVLTLLLNDLLVRKADGEDHVILVLDDYHVITDETIHSALSFLLDHLPPQIHLVLSTREDPSLPLARLRGRDALVELRASDLQFTLEETTTYLVQVMSLPVSAEQSALLEERTEGWITGLQLAAHSLQGHDDPADFIRTFSGCHRYVVDYLLEEVLHHQPVAIQDFLLHTCILERLCAALCDAVRAQSDSQAMLDILEQANLFLFPLDEERRWYRYHPLFAQVLRQRLQQTTPTLVPTLHRRASRWYEQHGLLAEAVSHTLAAPAFEEADRLIEQCAERFILGNQMQPLAEWLHALPETLVLARPALCLTHAIALIYTNHREMASARLQAIERELCSGQDTLDAYERTLLGQVTAGWSLLAHLSGDLERCVALAQQALDLLPETEMTPLSLLLRLTALLGAARAYLVSGDVTMTSEDQFTHTAALARTFNYRLATFRVLTLFARFQLLQGRLHQAAATYAEAARLERPEEWQVFADSPSYSFGLGDLLCEWNALEAAEEHLTQGMDLIRTHVLEADEVWLGYAALARLQHARGRDDQALATLDAFLQLAHHRHIAPVLVAQAAAMKAHIELTRDNLSAALRWAVTSGLSADDPLSYPREREYLTLARVRIAQGRLTSDVSFLAEALSLLRRLLAEAEAKERRHSALEILLLRALALQAQGNCTAALAVLGCALSLAEPEGYVRLFLDEGPPMQTLLRQAQRRGILPEYTRRLLATWDEPKATDTHLHVSHSSALMEPLTCREREVLGLLLEGATNQEIACHLVLSVNTVKKHILNICGKLNVRSRAQVIAKARTIQLLDEQVKAAPLDNIFPLCYT